MNSPVRPTYLERCDRILAGMSRGLIIGSMFFLAVMTILIALQVASRNFFSIGLPWADELARFTGLGVVFFTVPLLQYRGRHIAVDIFSSKLKGIASVVLRCINEAAVLVFCILLLVSFAHFLQRAAHFSTPAMGMPNWLFYAPALIGVICCTLVTSLRLLRFCSCKGVGADDHHESTPTGDKQP
ncbi:TRAP transporter small permease [Desulfopila sp. IMCC35008]|uniref:TRAP transporter small permease n=1 Tax=Desulfopila sp. IMCC35008 TaxID=2653858 RepID=UPI00197A9F0E|nr:TRAP transporter small permease [Desulfopila sp. IMCC35008]